MFNFIALFISFVQLFYIFGYGSGLVTHKINPYEQVFKMLIKEPPINNKSDSKDFVAVKEQWLRQPVDHFDGSNTETWLMRYFANDHFYREGCPIFVFVGGEWEIMPHLLQSGHFYDMAKQQEAIMFYTEHRYYGHSWPKSDASIQNLQYLNVLQSLADVKNFLSYQKSSRKSLENSKVVLVGGSYSGSMVSWFMKLYPQMADVAWASSAPLVAKMDFKEYMTLTMSSLQHVGGSSCAQKLDKAFQSLAQRMHSVKAGKILKRLKVCNTFNASHSLDRQAFFYGLANYFGGLVQSYSSFIPQFCITFIKMDTNPMEALIKYFVHLFLNSQELKLRGEDEEDFCLNFSYEGIKSIFTNVNELTTGTRPWFYQTCHEFGWFSTTNENMTKANDILPAKTTSEFFSPPTLTFGGQVPLSYYQQLCQDVFGNFNHAVAQNLGHGTETQQQQHPQQQQLTLQQMHNRALAINKLFGGFSNVSERVVYTHGLLDPWRAAGLQYGHNVLLIKDYSHVQDMGSINLADTVEMNVVKLKVSAFINRMLRPH